MKTVIRCSLLLMLALLVLPAEGLFLIAVPSLVCMNPGRTAMMLHNGDAPELTWLKLKEMAPELSRAVIAAEDSRFLEHSGIDWIEVEKTWRQNGDSGKPARGASTITMQVAKNLYLTPRKNFARKALEAVLALWLEAWLTKARILEIYLNVAQWGDGVYGAHAAAKHYFGKNPAELNAHEAAFLAAILPDPVSWGRYAPGAHVAKRMRVIQGYMRDVAAPDTP